MNRLQMAILCTIKVNEPATFKQVFQGTSERMKAKLQEDYVKNFLSTMEGKKYISSFESKGGILHRTTVTKYKVESGGDIKLRGINIHAV